MIKSLYYYIIFLIHWLERLEGDLIVENMGDYCTEVCVCEGQWVDHNSDAIAKESRSGSFFFFYVNCLSITSVEYMVCPFAKIKRIATFKKIKQKNSDMTPTTWLHTTNGTAVIQDTGYIENNVS